MLSQSLGLSTEKDGGPLDQLEGVGPQTACLPTAVLGLELDLEPESFGLGAGGQAGEMIGPQALGFGLSHGWGEAIAAPAPSGWRRPGGHRAQRAPVRPSRPPPVPRPSHPSPGRLGVRRPGCPLRPLSPWH